jgi:hypothetical protein
MLNNIAEDLQPNQIGAASIALRVCLTLGVHSKEFRDKLNAEMIANLMFAA